MPGHVEKKGNKWYAVVEFRNEAGNRKRKWHSGFRTKKEATKFLNEQLHKIDIGTYVEPNKIKLKDFIERWLNDYAKTNLAPRSYEGYEYIFRQHIIPQLGHYKLDQLKPTIIQGYYTNRLQVGRKDGKGGLSARSVLHHHRLLHEILNHAVRWQLIPINHAKAVIPPKPTKKKINILNKGEITQLLDGLKKTPLYDAVFIAINTGMRRGEIFGLRWKDINFHQATISVNQTLQRIHKIGLMIRDTTKTDGSQRTIAISESVIAHLNQIKKQQKKKCYWQDASTKIKISFSLKPMEHPLK